MKKWTSWLACLLIISLLTACGADVGSYVKNEYSLVSVDGNGNNLSKVYSVEGKAVPSVAAELAEKETPQEKSKDSSEQMFLLYTNKVINIQKDPQNSNNTLIQIDSIQYAQSHYDSSFLQGYLTASLLQSIFGGSWFNKRTSDYRGYTKTPTYSTNGGTMTMPATSERTGSFSTGDGSSSTRKNDGSKPSNKVAKPFVSRPKTSTRSGSFRRR